MFGPYTVAIIASLLLFPFVALVAFIPFAFRSYRQYGQLGWLHSLVFYSFVLYAIALLAFATLPLPAITPDFCILHNRGPQLNPFQFVVELQGDVPNLTIRNVISNGGFLHAFFNVLFFVPLGFYLRYYYRIGAHLAVVLSFGVTLLLELSQLTGLWGIYPCAYRLFDVDDLILNTSGAFIGYLLALLLRLLPRPAKVLPGGANRVTVARIAVAFAIDLFVTYVVPAIGYLAVFGLLYLVYNYTPQIRYGGPIASLFQFATGLINFLLLPLVWRGYTIGKFVVGIRIAAPDGARPTAAMILTRYLALMFPLTILTVIADTISADPLRPVVWVQAIIVAQIIVVLANVMTLIRDRERRSLSSRISHTRNIDADEVNYGRATDAG